MRRFIQKLYSSSYKLVGVLLLTVSFNSLANFEASPNSKVQLINQFSSWINGSIVIKLATNGTTCSAGYFIDSTSSSHENVLSILMAAKLADVNVSIMGITTSVWAGSTQPYCEIHSVELAG